MSQSKTAANLTLSQKIGKICVFNVDKDDFCSFVWEFLIRFSTAPICFSHSKPMELFKKKPTVLPKQTLMIQHAENTIAM